MIGEAGDRGLRRRRVLEHAEADHDVERALRQRRAVHVGLHEQVRRAARAVLQVGIDGVGQVERDQRAGRAGQVLGEAARGRGTWVATGDPAGPEPLAGTEGP